MMSINFGRVHILSFFYNKKLSTSYPQLVKLQQLGLFGQFGAFGVFGQLGLFGYFYDNNLY